MRSITIVSVLLATGALATPLLDRRVLVTENVVVTVTDYVTVGDVAAKVAVATSASSPPAVTSKVATHAHHYHHQAAKSPVVVVPVPQQSLSSKPYVAPAPAPTTTTSPKAYVPPPQLTTTTSPPETTAASSPVKVSSSPSANNDNTLPTTAVPNLDSGSEIYKGLAAQHHNVHRQNHSVPALTWNDTLASYAETIAKSCVYAHDRKPGGGGYGQNIAAGIEPGQIAKVASNMWYNGEEALYPTPYGNDSPDMSGFEGWGHYSQVVWSDSESVGCYTSTCFPAGGDPQGCKADGTSYLSGVSCGDGYPGQTVGVPAYFTVCNYYPPGNYANDYSKVKAPGSMGTVEMNKANVVTGL